MYPFFFSIKTSPKPINQRSYSFQDIRQAESKASVSHRRWDAEWSADSACLRVPRAVAEPGRAHLNDGVAELQRVHELDERREQEPVVPQQAVPLLALLLQLGRQRRVQAAEPRRKHLGSETRMQSVLPLGSSPAAGAPTRRHRRWPGLLFRWRGVPPERLSAWREPGRMLQGGGRRNGSTGSSADTSTDTTVPRAAERSGAGRRWAGVRGGRQTQDGGNTVRAPSVCRRGANSATACSVPRRGAHTQPRPTAPSTAAPGTRAAGQKASQQKHEQL